MTRFQSKFLRSGCCDAPVRQWNEHRIELFPVLCTRCGQELGAPGVEDLPPDRAREISWHVMGVHLRVQEWVRFQMSRHRFDAFRGWVGL